LVSESATILTLRTQLAALQRKVERRDITIADLANDLEVSEAGAVSAAHSAYSEGELEGIVIGERKAYHDSSRRLRDVAARCYADNKPVADALKLIGTRLDKLADGDVAS
jgi:hypothetical protein